MKTRQRLIGLRDWLQATVCDGRKMKAPPNSMDTLDFTYQDPKVYIGFAPQRPNPFDPSGDRVSVAPSIIVMPNPAKQAYIEEKRWDRFDKIRRNKEMGQHFNVTMLCTVYEPGVRDAAFAMEDNIDVKHIDEGTEQGIFTLSDWMDDIRDRLLSQQFIPNTDLFLDAESLIEAFYTDENYIVDKRPLYYGYVACDFGCFAERHEQNPIDDFLR